MTSGEINLNFGGVEQKSTLIGVGVDERKDAKLKQKVFTLGVEYNLVIFHFILVLVHYFTVSKSSWNLLYLNSLRAYKLPGISSLGVINMIKLEVQVQLFVVGVVGLGSYKILMN